RLEGVDDLLGVELEALGELIGRGRTAPLVGDPLLRIANLQRALLRSARNVHRPAGVAEVAAHLAEDGRHGEGLEGMTAFDVIAVHRLQQAEGGHLEQILERLRRAPVATGQAAGERHETCDERLARGVIAVALPAEEELAGILGARRSRAWCRSCDGCPWHLDSLPLVGWPRWDSTASVSAVPLRPPQTDGLQASTGEHCRRGQRRGEDLARPPLKIIADTASRLRRAEDAGAPGGLGFVEGAIGRLEHHVVVDLLAAAGAQAER